MGHGTPCRWLGNREDNKSWASHVPDDKTPSSAWSESDDVGSSTGATVRDLPRCHGTVSTLKVLLETG